MYIVQRYVSGNSIYSGKWIDIDGPQKSETEAKQLGINAMQSGEYGEVSKIRIVNVLQVISHRL